MIRLIAVLLFAAVASQSEAQGGTAYELEAPTGVTATQRKVVYALVRAGYPVERATDGLVVVANLVDPKDAGLRTWVRVAIDGDADRTRLAISGQWTSATSAGMSRALGVGDYLQWQPIDDTKRGEAKRAAEQLTTLVAVVRAALQPKP